MTKIQTAMQGGTPPDVFVSLATQRFTMASTGMAMPLDDLIAADGEEGQAYICLLYTSQVLGSGHTGGAQGDSCLLYTSQIEQWLL